MAKINSRSQKEYWSCQSPWHLGWLDVRAAKHISRIQYFMSFQRQGLLLELQYKLDYTNDNCRINMYETASATFKFWQIEWTILNNSSGTRKLFNNLASQKSLCQSSTYIKVPVLCAPKQPLCSNPSFYPSYRGHKLSPCCTVITGFSSLQLAVQCTTLHCTALHCTAALHCTSLHCTALQITTLHFNAVVDTWQLTALFWQAWAVSLGLACHHQTWGTDITVITVITVITWSVLTHLNMLDIPLAICSSLRKGKYFCILAVSFVCIDSQVFETKKGEILYCSWCCCCCVCHV